ncbi:hypothetical protein AYI69_g10547 [Smittium culicis]|uniref:Uncharacterized protein n=1 Tax=Smittium culicis TaxID=133412 RepID=A0A1R1X568_9FUNG|nr:hypothetical protein AYI69_g10547 [Smittium culicis]
MDQTKIVLPEKYYDSNSSLYSNSGKKYYKHKWSFVSNSKDRNEKKNDGLVESNSVHKNFGGEKPTSSNLDVGVAGKGPVFDKKVHLDLMLKEKEAENKSKLKRDYERFNSVIEQVAPKETGRQAQIAEKRARNRFLHREKDVDVIINEDEMFNSNSYQEALLEQRRAEERRKSRMGHSRQQQKESDSQKRYSEYVEKEKGTIEMLRQLAENSNAHQM